MNRSGANTPQKRRDPAYKSWPGHIDHQDRAGSSVSGEGMLNQNSQRSRLLRAFAVAAIALSFTALGVSAVRAEEDDESLMTKFMKGLGFQKPGEDTISYSERSPLVVPPSRDLPRPIEAAAPAVPDWPKDKDVKRRKDAKAKKKNFETYDFTEDARPLRPAELDKGRYPGADEGKVAPNHGDSSVGQVRAEDGASRKSIFSFDWFRKDEYATFTGEPSRGELTDPPSGYRTPSPDQPYGINPDRSKTKNKTIGDRMEAQAGR